MLMPNALENAFWLRPTKRRRAVMSSPDWTLPAMSLRRWLARIAPLQSLLFYSRVSLIRSSQGFLIHPLFSLRRPSGTDDSDRSTRSFGPDDDDNPTLNRSNRNEAVLLGGMVLVVDFQVISA